MGYTMKGSPAKLGTIKGTAGHASALKMKAEADAASALKDLGHGGHPGMTESEAAAATHGGKMSDKDKKRRSKAGTETQYTPKPKETKETKETKVAKGGTRTWKQGMKASGGTLNELVAQRKGLKKGSAEYAAVQNQINKALGSKKVHTATAPAAKPTKEEKIVKKQERKVDKAIISKTKQEGKLAAKQPESDKGTKISREERAKIKSKKLAQKVESDVEAGRKGLGSKIRAKRAARKAKKVKEKYGESPAKHPEVAKHTNPHPKKKKKEYHGVEGYLKAAFEK